MISSVSERTLVKETNIIKYLKKACPKVKNSEFKSLYGVRTMTISNDPLIDTYVYLTNDLKFVEIQVTKLQANMEIAKRINIEVCIKEKLPEDTHQFFNFMIDCKVMNDKLMVVGKYFPENTPFGQYIKNNFPLIYSNRMNVAYRMNMDTMIFDLANAVNILHNHGIILNDISMESIGLTSTRKVYFKNLSQVTLDETNWEGPLEVSVYKEPEMFEKKGDGYSTDVFKLGLVFFQMLNGIKAPEYLRSVLRGGLMSDAHMDISQLTFPENFAWMRHMLVTSSVRLCSNQIVRGIAQNVVVSVIFEDFQGYEGPPSKQKKAEKKSIQNKNRNKGSSSQQGIQQDSFKTKKFSEYVFVDNYMDSGKVKDGPVSFESLPNVKERIFKMNEPLSTDYSFSHYKMTSLELNFAASGSPFMFLI